ncbi:MAG: hypothetical protein PHD51_04585 [Patescibacteria group bacterium]|nr:hypothetical protein [Patescibacteria group bacterium]MDD5490794.1 hypothetical protein [Patescibacteria group bacterium]
MEKKLTLSPGVDTFTLSDLLTKTAAYKGLKLEDENVPEAGFKSIKEYVLSDNLLAVLAKQGITPQARLDCRNKIFTLVDENPQKEIPGEIVSNYWNFLLLEDDGDKFDLRVSLNIEFEVSGPRRGIVFWPQAHGPYVSPSDSLPHFRMFKILVESDKDAPAIARELAASNGDIVVTWANLGLSGIRSLADIFTKLVGNNEIVEQLGSTEEVFDPVPNPQHQQAGEELFVTKLAQPKIIQIWRRQLEKYRNQLVNQLVI